MAAQIWTIIGGVRKEFKIEKEKMRYLLKKSPSLFF